MNNQYLSRYEAGETHFKRTDPFPLASFDDTDDDSLLIKVLACCGLIALFLAIVLL